MPNHPPAGDRFPVTAVNLKDNDIEYTLGADPRESLPDGVEQARDAGAEEVEHGRGDLTVSRSSRFPLPSLETFASSSGFSTWGLW